MPNWPSKRSKIPAVEMNEESAHKSNANHYCSRKVKITGKIKGEAIL
jgi:hypothetical protein